MTSSYLIVDTIVVATTFLDGHAGLAVTEEARVTLAALRTGIRALWGGTECRAAQGAGVCAELIVAVGGARHCCKEGVWFRAPGKEGAGPKVFPFCASTAPPPRLLVSAFSAPLLTTERFIPPGFDVASKRLASTHIGMNVTAENVLASVTHAEVKDTVMQGTLGIKQLVAGGQWPSGAGEEPTELLLLVLILQLRSTLRRVAVFAGLAGGWLQAGRARHGLLPGVTKLIGAGCLRAVRLLEVILGVTIVVPAQAT